MQMYNKITRMSKDGDNKNGRIGNNVRKILKRR